MHDSLFDTDPTFNFDDPNWRRFPQKKHEELGLVGNELWSKKPAKAGALTCPVSNRSEKIAVSQSGLNYLHAAVQRGDDITSGQVVFFEWDDKKRVSVIIIRMNVVDVFNKVKDSTPRQGKQGKHGPFYLFYRDGTSEDDEEVPF
jgi:hypothetical protein